MAHKQSAPEFLLSSCRPAPPRPDLTLEPAVPLAGPFVRSSLRDDRGILFRDRALRGRQERRWGGPMGRESEGARRARPHVGPASASPLVGGVSYVVPSRGPARPVDAARGGWRSQGRSSVSTGSSAVDSPPPRPGSLPAREGPAPALWHRHRASVARANGYRPLTALPTPDAPQARGAPARLGHRVQTSRAPVHATGPKTPDATRRAPTGDRGSRAGPTLAPRRGGRDPRPARLSPGLQSRPPKHAGLDPGLTPVARAPQTSVSSAEGDPGGARSRLPAPLAFSVAPPTHLSPHPKILAPPPLGAGSTFDNTGPLQPPSPPETPESVWATYLFL